MHEIPEKALKCFETWSGLQVTFYDWTNSFTNCIVQERRLHMNEFCRVRKISLQYANCLQCDYLQTQSKAWMLRDGAVKICHAGALELVVSIFSGYRFLAILTAGLRRPPEMLPDHLLVLRDNAVLKPEEPVELPEISAEEIELTLEGFRQLAARLKLWYESSSGKLFQEEKMPRPIQIEYMVQEHAHGKLSLEDMAETLHLSVKRTAGVIKETTGRTLGQLIREKRIQRAKTLLEHTGHSIVKIAEASGYPDVANFHRQFKKSEGITPAQYRRLTIKKRNEDSRQNSG